ncbi:L-rhamnose-binding lectin CSL3-like [Syngnathus typhle]|uniref:L-rhamnose-binding lectin CSL3-like n=1 Tax=Syngnathus typhle TaxID=161592 RepID=UPI002A6B2C39|nr:L-rhamnose-binding lectin CSL3-like [Syngnathus typhle]
MFTAKLTAVSLLLAACYQTSDADGSFVDVACPGVNSVLQCPAGHRIRVTAVDYGLQENADCSNRQQAAQVSTENGVHPQYFIWMKSICDGEPRCRLPKPDPTIFTENWSPDNFIQIAYDCEKETEGLMRTYVCEGDTETIRCDRGELRIQNAKYGRLDENICTDESSVMTFCNSPTTMIGLNFLCNGGGVATDSCTVTADDNTLGVPAPCDDLPKYLAVDYYCTDM